MLAFGWMHTFEKIGFGHPNLAIWGRASTANAWLLAASVALGTLLAGCASPGPPLPPSLKLPKIVSNLTAERVGDQVVLHWTTPDQTTDGLDIQGPVTAEICRDLAAVPAAPTPASSQPKPALCNAVLRRAVQPGASEASDDLSSALPSPLNAGPIRLLAYRVQLRNSAGRTAGPSGIAYAPSGPSIPPIQELHIRATKAGALLEWKPDEWKLDPAFAAANPAAKSAFVDLDRIPPEPSNPASGPQPASLTKPKPLPEAHLRVAAGTFGDAADPGGAIDPTALVGATYSYTAQRVRTVVLAGHSVELRSLVSAPVSVVMVDIFPPDAPTDLVAVPGFLAPNANPTANPAEKPLAPKPTIDLSWQPGAGDRIAGYRVYRSEVQIGETTRPSAMTASLVPTSAYRDLTVEAGHTYIYRVTAVDTTGNESPPSDPATETAPTQ